MSYFMCSSLKNKKQPVEKMNNVATQHLSFVWKTTTKGRMRSLTLTLQHFCADVGKLGGDSGVARLIFGTCRRGRLHLGAMSR